MFHPAHEELMCASEQSPPQNAGFRESFNAYLGAVSGGNLPRHRNTGQAGLPHGGAAASILKGQTMTSKLTLSALAILISTSVFAAPVFAGATQLERSADVAPGVYTIAQAGEIASAETAADAARLRAFYADANTGDVTRNVFSVNGTTDAPVRLGGSDRR